jgi:hypothetical protein
MAIKKLPSIIASTGRGKYRVKAEAKTIGADIIVSIWGGAKPHIGSVAVAIPRPSLKKSGKMSATSSVLNFVGHKEETVTKLFSERIAARLNRNCIATAGIHIENATNEDVDSIMKNCGTLCTRMLTLLEKQT